MIYDFLHEDDVDVDVATSSIEDTLDKEIKDDDETPTADVSEDELLTSEEESALEEDLKNPNALLEAFLLDEISRMSDSEKEAFVKSEACEMLIKEGMIAKRNVVKLTKTSDLERRVKVAALQIAKAKGDPLYAKALKFRAMSKQNVAAIVKKYGSKAERAAKIAQKAYIRVNPITQRIVATPEKIDKKELFDTDRSSSTDLK